MRTFITRLFTFILLFAIAALSFAKTGDTYNPVKSNAGRVAAGWSHTVVLKADGTVATWGGNNSGQLGDGTTIPRSASVAVPGLGGVVALTTGDDHTVALKADGTLVAWGSNNFGQLGDGTTINRTSPVVPGIGGVVAVAAGWHHTVTLTANGTVLAWGDNSQGQLGDGTKLRRTSPVVVLGVGGVAIAAGDAYTVALKADGTVMTWGDNSQGQLGDDTTISRTSPVAVPGLSGVVAIAAGIRHTVALKADGTVVTWGGNNSGELGDGTTISRTSPVAVPGLSGVVAVAAGAYHTVALKADGTVVAWGSGLQGQLGGGLSFPIITSPVAVPGLSGVVALAAGGYHTVALKADGTLVAWGQNSSGQLGDGTLTNRSSPVAVLGLPVADGVSKVAAGSLHAGALKANGTVITWGDNYSGQLGDGTTTNRISPVTVPGLSGVAALAAGDSHTVALKADGTVVAWGSNAYYQLGDGTTINRASPTIVPELSGVVTVAAGIWHTVALKADGTVMTWGNNYYGQLGDGTTINRASPTTVPGLSGVVAVAAGGMHTVAIKADGTVVTWGYNGYGQLGDDTTIDRTSPVIVPGLSGVVAVAAGAYHTVALKADGTLVAWGYNGLGQLGDGTTTDRTSPAVVPGLYGVVALAAGAYHTTVALSDNVFWPSQVLAWGWNYYGQLGAGTTTDSASPIAVQKLTGVVAVAAGDAHTVALKADGTLVTWGYNGYGQLGVGTSVAYSLYPVGVLGYGGVPRPSLSYSSAMASYGAVGVWPTTGLTNTVIAYKVVYTHPYAAPNPIMVCIDGGGSSCSAMRVDTSAEATLRDGNFANGEQYVYTTLLAAGTHNYYFTATDGVDSVSLPNNVFLYGPLSGPTIDASYIDLVMTTVSKVKTTIGVGHSFDITNVEKNQGSINMTSISNVVKFYLSLDNIITAADIPLIGSRVIPALAAGMSSPSALTTVTVPYTLLPGVYNVGACADVPNVQRETDENNNCTLAGGGLTTSTITVTRTVNLQMSAVSKTTTVIGVGKTFTITNTEKNAGTTNMTAASNTIKFFLSLDSIITTADISLTGDRVVTRLLAGQSSPSLATTVTVPTTVAPRVYYVGACADVPSVQIETIETDNCRAAAGTVNVVRDVDLIVNAVSATAASVKAGGSFVVSNTEKNQGTAAMLVGTTNSVSFYLSTDATITSADILLTGNRTVAALAAGASSIASTLVTIPTTVLPRVYYIGAIADSANQLLESVESNNALAGGTITVTSP